MKKITAIFFQPNFCEILQLNELKKSIAFPHSGKNKGEGEGRVAMCLKSRHRENAYLGPMLNPHTKFQLLSTIGEEGRGETCKKNARNKLPYHVYTPNFNFLTQFGREIGEEQLFFKVKKWGKIFIPPHLVSNWPNEGDFFDVAYNYKTVFRWTKNGTIFGISTPQHFLS